MYRRMLEGGGGGGLLLVTITAWMFGKDETKLWFRMPDRAHSHQTMPPAHVPLDGPAHLAANQSPPRTSRTPMHDSITGHCPKSAQPRPHFGPWVRPVLFRYCMTNQTNVWASVCAREREEEHSKTVCTFPALSLSSYVCSTLSLPRPSFSVASQLYSSFQTI